MSHAQLRQHQICFVHQVGEEAAGAVEDAKEMFADASEEVEAEEE